jgi:hypothetical protein
MRRGLRRVDGLPETDISSSPTRSHGSCRGAPTGELVVRLSCVSGIMKFVGSVVRDLSETMHAQGLSNDNFDDEEGGVDHVRSIAPLIGFATLGENQFF